MRTLVIGDIHGCLDESMDLLDRAYLSADDEIIASAIGTSAAQHVPSSEPPGE